MSRHVKENAGFAISAGLILLLYGFYLGIGTYVDHGPFYVFLIHLFRWTVRIGGFVLIGVGIVCWSGRPFGLLLDAIASLLVGLTMAGCVVGWFFYEKGIEIYNIVALVVGIMLARSGYTNLLLYRELPKSTGERSDVTSVAPEPTLKISSSVLPKDGEPPPEEGYLAALSREKDDPPGKRRL